MIAATATEVQRDFAFCRAVAEGSRGAPGPVTVMDGGHASVVIASAVEFARPTKRDKRSMATEDLPEWLVEQIAASETDPKFARPDHPA